MPDSKCIILLSEKSSGSSAFLRFLTTYSHISHVEKTRHYENETLYWTKAASILELPQIDMVDSEVPLEREKARADLITLLSENLDNYSPPDDDRELIMGGWKLLCEKYAPIFFEKSPHHLCQWSAIELILECSREIHNVDFLLVGLVRNPLATFYSQFRRWGARPEQLQAQWLEAYQNLLRLKGMLGDQLVIVRYEDIVSSTHSIKPILDFCDISLRTNGQNYWHGRSLWKWKADKFFGFSPSDEVISLAKRYGYQDEELYHKPKLLWPIYRESSRAVKKSKKYVKKIAVKAR